MKPIRLQFVCGAISSQVIASFSAGHFSHVDALLDDGTLLGARSDRVGGQPPGVQIRSPDYINFSRRVVMEIPATDAQNTTFHAFLHSQIGKPYDSEAIWAFLFNRDWRETDSWIVPYCRRRGWNTPASLRGFISRPTRSLPCRLHSRPAQWEVWLYSVAAWMTDCLDRSLLVSLSPAERFGDGRVLTRF